jgi:carbamate kinase
MYQPGTRTLVGVEAVIDKDRASAVLAGDLAADLLVIATDVDAVYLDWGTPQQRAVVAAHPDALDPALFPAGSMGPKVEAAAHFARASGRPPVIGAREQRSSMLAGDGGTRNTVEAQGMETR